MDLARAPRRTARKKGSGYENGTITCFSLHSLWSIRATDHKERGLWFEIVNFVDFKDLGESDRNKCLAFREAINFIMVKI
jgi:hypothetical protein